MKIRNSINLQKILILITICMSIVTFYQISTTYALFYSAISGTSSKVLGKWNISINSTNISSGVTQNFTINTLNIIQNTHTKADKVAPGMAGYFDINVNANDTQVSVRYDITIDDSNLEESNMRIKSVEEIEGNSTFIQTGEKTYTGIINLANMTTNHTNTIRINFEWQNNEEYNELDTNLGIMLNSKFEIPIQVRAIQYLGEEIISI